MKISSSVLFSLGLLAILAVSVQFLIGKDNIIAARTINCAPAMAASAGPANEAQLIQAIDTLRQAMINADLEKITSVASPSLSFGHSNGVVQSREEFVGTVQSGAEIFKRIDLTNRQLKITGNTAVERHHFSADIILGGELKTFELEIVQVWRKSDRWRLAVRQAFKT